MVKNGSNQADQRAHGNHNSCGLAFMMNHLAPESENPIASLVMVGDIHHQGVNLITIHVPHSRVD